LEGGYRILDLVHNGTKHHTYICTLIYAPFGGSAVDFFGISHGDGTQALPLFFDLLDGDYNGFISKDAVVEPKI